MRATSRISLLLCIALVPSTLFAAPLFESAFRSFPAGIGAHAVALGDVTHDGWLDVVVTNSQTSTVSLLVNAGDGSFLPPTSYGTGGASHMRLADVSGDGRLDVVYVVDAVVGVMLGRKGGGFGFPVTYPNGPGAGWLTLADMNADGILDAVTVGSDVGILPGDGHGRFGARQSVAMGGSCVSTEDLNGDGLPDLAVTSPGGTFLYVRLALATGGFGPVASYAVGINPGRFIVADMNADGRPDFVVDGNQTVVLLNGGNGTFLNRIDLGTAGREPVIADFDLDGVPDIAFTNGSCVSVVRGLGGGAFAPPQNFFTGFGSSSIAAGDVDGDGFPDIATTNGGPCTVSVLYGNGDGTFGRGLSFHTQSSPRWCAVGDVDGDDIADLAVISFDESIVQFYNGTGAGQFTLGYRAGVNDAWAGVLQDLNGDGLADLATAGQGIEVQVNDGAGAFMPPRIYEFSVNFTRIAAGDLNGDGIADLAAIDPGEWDLPWWVPEHPHWIPHTRLSVFFGVGDGTFAAETVYTVGSTPGDLLIADANGDGRNDVLVANQGDHNVSVLLGEPSGRLRVTVPYATVGPVHALALADVNGDALPDLMCAGENDVQMLLGLGNGTFGPADVIGSFSLIASVTAADIDHDEHVDLIATPGYANGITILRGAGDGTFAAPETYGFGEGPQNVVVRDFDQDGLPDLAVATLYSANLGIFLTRLPTRLADPRQPDPGSARLQLAVSPNPIHADGAIFVTLSSRDRALVQVVDAAGRRVWECELEGALGRQNVRWPVEGRRSGVYFVSIEQAGQRTTRRVVVVR